MLSKLRRGRLVQVVAIQPHTDSIDELSLLSFRRRLRGGYMMQIQIRRDTD